MDLPPGTDMSIRRQAFEIGTVLAGYPKVKVVVVSDETGRELSVKAGTITADGAWSGVLEKIANRIQAAAGDFVPAEPILPEPGSFNPSVLFGRLRALNYRCATLLDSFDIQWQGGLLKGIIDGFWAGVDGDKQAVSMLKTAFTQNPITSAKAIGDFFGEVKKAFPSLQDLKRSITNIYQNWSGNPTLDDVVLWAGQGAYCGGFLAGFVYEQALVGIAVAATTTVIGEAAKLAMNALKGIAWIASITQKAAAIIHGLGFLLEAVAKLTGIPDLAKACLNFLIDSQEALVKFFQQYDKVDKIMKRLVQTLQLSKALAGRVLYWFTIFDRMGEEAGLRFILFFEKKGAALSERVMARWAGLQRGRRAVKATFEAWTKAGEAADGAHDALVLAGNLDEAAPARYVSKYGERVESSLTRLRQSIDDSRFSDDAVGQVVTDLSASNAPVLSDKAVEGAASSVLESCP
jgi:hypothetical protein